MTETAGTVRKPAEHTGIQTRGMSRDGIKYIAMVTMLLNHISTIFMESGSVMAEVFLDIGYFTAPVMCYFLAEGYQYTHSKRKYGCRLALFALISEIPYCLAFTTEGVIGFAGMNMIFTLLLCFCILYVLDRVSGRLARVLAVAGLILLSSISDWALLAPVFTLLFAWAGRSKQKTAVAFGIAALLFGLLNFEGGVGRFPVGINLLYTLGCMAGVALAGIAIVCLYNGKRMEKGKEFSKWFFYLFYPVHLLVLGVIRVLG